MQIKDKLAKSISDALEMMNFDSIVKYAKILTYLKNQEQMYFNKKSALNVDTLFELYSKYCDDFIVENFCARVVYFDKLNNAKLHADEINKLGNKRLLELLSIINNSESKQNIESKKLYENDEYIKLIHDWKKAKDASEDVKLINYALTSKEKEYNKFRNNKNTAINYLCEILTGKESKDISSDVKNNILNNTKEICNRAQAVK